MSRKEPGIMFDAMRSWNGYNHQGKIALWYAIREINNLMDSNLTKEENRAKIDKYFLEIEYMEDFAIGEKNDDEVIYHSVHQVKDRAASSISEYEYALLGLLEHVISDNNIEGAFLHLSTEPDLNGKELSDILSTMARNAKNLTDIEKEIKDNRHKTEYRNSFLPKKGGKRKLTYELEQALFKAGNTQNRLNDANLDLAFDKLLENIEQKKKLLSSLTEDQLEKVKIFEYDKKKRHCGKAEASQILENAIRDFYNIADPNGCKVGERSAKNGYLFIMEKTGQHIVERSLNYDAYKRDEMDRRISFSAIFDWLFDKEIDKKDDEFYLYHIKEFFFEEMDEYCENCEKEKNHCSLCPVIAFKDNLSGLSFNYFKNFLYVTSPHVNKPLNMNAFAKYSSPGIRSPFLKGLRDIERDFVQEDKNYSITYIRIIASHTGI